MSFKSYTLPSSLPKEKVTQIFQSYINQELRPSLVLISNNLQVTSTIHHLVFHPHSQYRLVIDSTDTPKLEDVNLTIFNLTNR